MTLWSDGNVVRTDRAPRVSSKAVPLAQVWGNTRDDLAFFSVSGQAIMTPLHQLPDEQNVPVSNLTTMASSEQLVSALVLPHPPEGEELPAIYLTMVTRGGRIKRVTLEDFTTAASRGTVTAMNVEEGDQLGWVAETGGQDEVLLVTRQGKAIRFSEEEVRPMGLSAAGVWAIKLDNDDGVVGMGVVRAGGFVATFSEQGYVKRTAVKSFPAQKRYGGGVQAAKLTSGTGPLAVAALADERADIVLTTTKGRVTKLPLKALHAQGRAASGYRIRQDTKDRYVEPDKHGLPALLTVLAGTKTAAKRARTSSATPTKSSRTRKTTPKKAPAKSSTRAKGTASTKKTTRSRSSKSKTTAAKETAGTPAPMKSAPSKTRKKPAPTKRKSVRSVPE